MNFYKELELLIFNITSCKQKKNKVKISIRYYQDEEHNFERSIISAKFKCGQFQEVKFVCHSLEDVVRMVINFNLAYMGDKAQFEFLGRKRTINF